MPRRLVALAVAIVASGLGGACGGPNDAKLAAEVRARLARDPSTPPAQIEVSSREGVVKLRGVVADFGAKRHAEELARSVHDVKGIDDELVIAETPRTTSADLALSPEDRALRDAVMDRLAKSGLHGTVAEVLVTDGVVTLRGAAPDRGAIRRATEEALAVHPRPKRVENDLTVRHIR